MRIVPPLPLLLLLVAAVPAGLSAQDPSPPVREGQRVRLAPNPVSPGERWLVGTVHRVGADTVWLRVPDFVEPVRVLRSDLRRVQVSRVRDRGARLLTGAVIGGALGVAGGKLLGDGGGTCMVCPPPEVALAVPGVLFGAVIGVSGGSERWVGARLPGDGEEASFAVAPLVGRRASGGAALGVSVRF